MTAEIFEVQWCTDCGKRFSPYELKGATACPDCGFTGVPCAVEQDCQVDVNWHELRILTIWAENYARQIDAATGDSNLTLTVTAIAGRLQRQQREFPVLTLSAEIAELPRRLEENGISVGGVKTNVERPKPVPVYGPGAVGRVRHRDPGAP